MKFFIPLIYCNEDRPENINVYISNFNDDFIRVFDGKNWIIEKKSDILEDIYNSKRDYLEYKFEDMYDKLGPNAKYFFEKFKEKNTEREVINSIQHDIKNILYANRGNIIKKPEKNKLKYIEYENTNDINYIPNKPMFY